jgi:hypothetical protein
MSSVTLCFRSFDSDNLNNLQVPDELLSQENVFLTSLNEYSFVYRWDNRLVEWINSSLNN